MAVLMAKCERFRQAYSDYKHLSSDNLSFVAGLRGRPVPAPVTDLGRQKLRRRPKGVTPKDKDDEGADEDTGGGDDDDDEDGSSMGTQTPRQACPGRSCAPRAEKLEAMVEKRAAAQTARHRAQIKLNLARERSQEAETKLEEAKAELVRMSQAITEGDERTESLQDALRNEGSVNKAIAEELDVLLVEAMNLRRQFTVDTLPPRPNTPIVPPPPDDDDEPPAYQEDGRTLESPITAPGQQRHEQQHHQAAKEGAGVAHSGGREWVHSGRRGHTEIVIRPPRPASNAGAAGAGGTATTTTATATAAAAQSRGSGGVEFSTTPGAASVAGVAKASPDGDEDGQSSGRPGRGGGGEGSGERGGGKSRSEAEEAWSCCGKTVESAGRGCEPREPLATPEDLLLDTIDPRSRLGQRLDFREFLPQTAWMGLTPDPVHLFAGSPSEGTLRPHTAPERLMDSPGQWNPLGAGGRQGLGGGGGGGEYQRRAARSRNGGLIGGVWASGGRRSRGSGGVTGQGRLGGAPPLTPSRGSSGVSAWGGNGTVGQWGSAAGYGGFGGVGGVGGVGVGGGGGGGGGRFSRPHEFLRRSRPDATTAAADPGTISATYNGGGITRFPPPDGRAVAGRGGTAAANAATITGIDEVWPRTQILGMNGGRLPRQVRQAPADRPLTAPCGKVGRRRVRTRGGSRGASSARP